VHRAATDHSDVVPSLGDQGQVFTDSYLLQTIADLVGAAPRISHQDRRADTPKTKIARLDEKTDALDEDTEHNCKRPRRPDPAALLAAQSVIGLSNPFNE
jgi:hypothetical protein